MRSLWETMFRRWFGRPDAAAFGEEANLTGLSAATCRTGPTFIVGRVAAAFDGNARPPEAGKLSDSATVLDATFGGRDPE
jgi:hypothetical protein